MKESQEINCCLSCDHDPKDARSKYIFTMSVFVFTDFVFLILINILNFILFVIEITPRVKRLGKILLLEHLQIYISERSQTNCFP